LLATEALANQVRGTLARRLSIFALRKVTFTELSEGISEICPAARALFVVETKQDKITEEQIPESLTDLWSFVSRKT